VHRKMHILDVISSFPRCSKCTKIVGGSAERDFHLLLLRSNARSSPVFKRFVVGGGTPSYTAGMSRGYLGLESRD